jgi:hypothetical protein
MPNFPCGLACLEDAVRKRIILVLVAAAVMGLAGWGLVRSPSPRVNRQTYERIEQGTTLAEVEAVLRAPVRADRLFRPISEFSLRPGAFVCESESH